MAKHSNDPTTAKGFYEGAINLIAGKRSEVKESDYRIAFLTEPIHIYQSYVEWLAVREDWQRALEVADSSHSQVLMEGYGRAKLSRAALQQFARESKSILLAYWLAPSGSFVWVITAGGIKGMPLDDTTDTEIKKLVAEHTANIEGSEEILGNPQSAGWKLYEKLLKPVEDRIPRDANVIVIPDGAINRLNLETLPAAGNQYWLERNTLSVAPSIEALLASGSGLVSWDKALIMGAVPQVDRFPKLAHAGKEIDAVRKHWRGQKPIVLEDKEATVTAYRASHPDEFSLIHFSSHADAKVERALNAAIITAEDANGYRLYARDVSRAEHRLRANLVTVSACESAGTMFYSGEGLIGFAWAFLHAGARNVVAGLWKADEDATAQLMDMFYAEIEKGNPPAAALRTAKLNLRPMAFNYSKPYYWGTFQLYRRSIR